MRREQAARRGRRRGKFIVLEGIDGAGTTTQAQELARALRTEGWRVHTTCEPSGGPVGRLLRRALLGEPALSPDTLALLFAADRTDHLQREVLPALERGEIVLSDRYVLSSLAYQGAELPMGWVQEINSRAIRPDLTLFLQVGVGVAARRRAGRGGAAELYDAEHSQRKIAQRYLDAIRRLGGERIARLDGARPVEEVTAAALREIRARLRLR